MLVELKVVEQRYRAVIDGHGPYGCDRGGSAQRRGRQTVHLWVHELCIWGDGGTGRQERQASQLSASDGSATSRPGFSSCVDLHPGWGPAHHPHRAG